MVLRPAISLNHFFIAVILFASACLSVNAQGKAEILPTKEQLAWADAELGVIIHLDINIYAPDTFDYANKKTLPDVNLFNPTKLNTDQWIRTAKAADARYALLTVKHGTGFCLWPSAVNT